MRTLDPRLLRRARAARALLALDVVLGLATTVAVVAQATLLARIVTRTFDGTPARTLAPALVALALVFAVRGGLGWGAAVAGRRAASTVLSQLRRALVRRRL